MQPADRRIARHRPALQLRGGEFLRHVLQVGFVNGYVTEVEYPKHGKKLKVHGLPWTFSETPARIGIAPELGEHNEAVLAELGYSSAQIQDFRERKVI